MSDGECRFELGPLSCSECGAFIGVLGTCEDSAWCEKCNSKTLAATLNDPNARSGSDLIYSPIEPYGPLSITKERR
jgi:hypothetical protein